LYGSTGSFAEVDAVPYVIAAIVAPIITALLGSIGVWWKDRRDRRDRDQERHRVLTQVREEVEVIEAWIRTYGLVVSDDSKALAWSRAENDLERAYVRLAGSLDAFRGQEMRTTLGQRLKVLLLIRPLQGWSTKVARVFYFISLGGVAIWVSAIAVVSIARPSDWSSMLLGFIIFLIGNFLISAGLYMLVRHLDQRACAAVTPQPTVEIGPSFRPSS
jgi:hypothetical protein